jgi:hypothetical protein
MVDFFESLQGLSPSKQQEQRGRRGGLPRPDLSQGGLCGYQREKRAAIFTV